MSGKPGEYPSAALMAELRGLCYDADPEKRRLRSWQAVLEASANSDFAFVWDFALEHDLIRACDEAAEKGRRVSWVNPIDGSEMVWVPPRPFLVGGKKRRVELPGFSLARHPVTNAQFKDFLDATGYRPPAGHPGAESFLSHWTGGNVPAGKERHPVVWVSFIDALYYCRWAGLALPSEWQWEKAARGTDGRERPWGADWSAASYRLLNVCSDDTQPVGSYPRTRTAYGCEDMIGNVSEWCQLTPKDEPTVVPLAWPDLPDDWDRRTARAAVRGSCFLRTTSRLMTCRHRRRLSLTRRNRWVGFRPALFLGCRPGP